MNFTGDFNRAPEGPFTEGNKLRVWGGCPFMTGLYDADPDGSYFSIVPHAPDGGHCCSMLYPKGSFGMKNQYYQIKIGSPATTVSVHYKIRLRSPGGADMASGPFKYAPAIQWGPIQSSGLTGTRQMITGVAQDNWPKARALILQDQHTGWQVVQPPKYTPPIVLDQWDDCELSMLGGNPGVVKWTVNKVLYSQSSVGNSLRSDHVLIDFAHFAGGGAPVNRTNDVYAEITSPTITIG